MPIISWTPGDVLQAKTVEAGNYAAELITADGPKASSSGKGINLFLSFRLNSGPAIGKELQIALSSGVKNGSVLGGLQFAPMGGTMALIDSAINNKPVVPEAGQADTDTLMHRPLTLVVGVDIIDGKPINVINGFLPEGAASAAPAF